MPAPEYLTIISPDSERSNLTSCTTSEYSKRADDSVSTQESELLGLAWILVPRCWYIMRVYSPFSVKDVSQASDDFWSSLSLYPSVQQKRKKNKVQTTSNHK